MQQADEAMKSSQTVVHGKRDGSVLNRGRWSGRRGWSVTERRGQAAEISVQQIHTPVVADRKTQSSIYLQADAKLGDAAQVLKRSKRLSGQVAKIPLPPINGPRIISGKVERTTAHRQNSAKPKGYRTNLSTGQVMRENTVFRLLVTQGRKGNQESNQCNKISVALAAGNKAAIQYSETRSRLVKRSFDGQPAATSTSAPAPVDPPAQQKNDASGPGANDSGTTMPVRAKHDASLCEAGQQRDFCSDDSAIETESEGYGDKGRLERLGEDSGDEYYTDQRITEWVLQVNTSLFSAGSNEQERSRPAEEEDVATIKIIYRGD